MEKKQEYIKEWDDDGAPSSCLPPCPFFLLKVYELILS